MTEMYSDWRSELLEEKEQLDELIAAALGAYLGHKAAVKGGEAIKKSYQKTKAKVANRMQRAAILKKAKQTEVGSQERKAALQQSKKLKKQLDQNIQKINRQKTKQSKPPKKKLSTFKKTVRRVKNKLKR